MSGTDMPLHNDAPLQIKNRIGAILAGTCNLDAAFTLLELDVAFALLELVALSIDNKI